MKNRSSNVTSGTYQSNLGSLCVLPVPLSRPVQRPFEEVLDLSAEVAVVLREGCCVLLEGVYALLRCLALLSELCVLRPYFVQTGCEVCVALQDPVKISLLAH